MQQVLAHPKIYPQELMIQHCLKVPPLTCLTQLLRTYPRELMIQHCLKVPPLTCLTQLLRTYPQELMIQVCCYRVREQNSFTFEILNIELNIMCQDGYFR